MTLQVVFPILLSWAAVVAGSLKTGYEAYRFRRFLPPLLVSMYAVTAVALKPADVGEFYPFFNWSLFSDTAERRIDATLQIRSVNGQAIDPPRLYYDMKEVFDAAQRGDAQLFKMIDHLLAARRRGDQTTEERLLELIESRFMKEAVEVEYDLVTVLYNPIERYRFGAVEETHVWASYIKGPH